MTTWPPGPRHRSDPDFDLPDTYETHFVNAQGVDTLTGSTTHLIRRTRRYMDDVVVPNAHRLIAGGHIINNPMSQYQYLYSAGGYSYNATNQYGERAYRKGGSLTHAEWTRSWTTDSGYKAADQLDYASAYSTIKQRCLAGIDKTPYSFMEDLFEARETLKTLRHPLESALAIARRMKQRAHDIRRKRIPARGKRWIARQYGWRQAAGDVANFGDAATEAWLLDRYGYSPIILTLLKGLESMNDLNKAAKKRRRFAPWTTISSSSSGTRVCSDSSGTASFAYTEKRTATLWAGVLYEDTNPWDSDPFEYYGLRWKEVPKTIWQVMPYTWVLDRFADVSSSIGGVLNLLDPSIAILCGWVKTETNTEYSRQLISRTVPNWTVSATGDVIYESSKTRSRSPWSPSVGDVLPTWTWDSLSDFRQTADLASLVWQTLRSL